MKSGRTLKLSEEAIREFRGSASSASLREDMKKATQLRKELEKTRPLDADGFLDFLTFFSNFFSDAPQRLKPWKELFMVL